MNEPFYPKRCVYKYPIVDQVDFTLELPKRSVILTVQTQRGAPMMWALVDPEEKGTEVRKFKLVGTGRQFTVFPGMLYHGTFQVQEGSSHFVFHLFEDTVTVVHN